MKVLLVEDEKQLNEALNQILVNEKYSVDSVYNGEDGLEYGLTNIYDIIILDIMLPKLNGLEVLRELRKKNISTPIILLTAKDSVEDKVTGLDLGADDYLPKPFSPQELLARLRAKKNISTPIILLTAKDSVEDKVTGLDLGADDYLPKPFSPQELLARLRALSRRKCEVISDNILCFGDIQLNLSNYDLICKNTSVTLTQKEFEILNYFMQRPKNIVSKDDLITKLWGFDCDIEYNNIEVYISFLGKKLTFIKSSVKITTIRRAGYKLEE